MNERHWVEVDEVRWRVVDTEVDVRQESRSVSESGDMEGTLGSWSVYVDAQADQPVAVCATLDEAKLVAEKALAEHDA